MKKATHKLPTKKVLREKEKKIEEAKNHIYTDKEVSEMISIDSLIPVNPVKARRMLQNKLTKELLKGEESEEVKKLREKIRVCEERIEESFLQEENERTKKLREINERNKQINLQLASLPLSSTSPADNVFSRRPTQPSLYLASRNKKIDNKNNNDSNNNNNNSNNNNNNSASANGSISNNAPPKTSPTLQGKVGELGKGDLKRSVELVSSSSSSSLLQKLGKDNNNNNNTLSSFHQSLHLDLSSPSLPSSHSTNRLGATLAGLTINYKPNKNTKMLTVEEYKRRRGLL